MDSDQQKPLQPALTVCIISSFVCLKFGTSFILLSPIRYAGVIWLLLIRHICVIGVWLGKDQRTNHKDTSFKEIGLLAQILSTNPHSILSTTRWTYVFSLEINKHALLIMITKSGKVQFSILFLLILYHRFANKAQILLCTSYW